MINMLLNIRRFKVIKKACKTTELCRVWLAPDDGGSVFEFNAGQFVMIHELDEEGKSVYVRSYSIASAPYESKESIEFGVKKQGKMSGMLFDAEVGQTFGIQGPYGMFKMPDHETVVFFSGGVGITPFRAMIRQALHYNSGKKLVLFYSGKTLDDLLYHDDYAQLASEYPDFMYIPILTREEAGDWQGETGRITDAMVKKYLKDFDAGFLMCGPTPMMDRVKEILEANNVNIKERLRAEQY